MHQRLQHDRTKFENLHRATSSSNSLQLRWMETEAHLALESIVEAQNQKASEALQEIGNLSKSSALQTREVRSELAKHCLLYTSDAADE